MEETARQLADLRQKLDQVDDGMVQLMKQRMAIARQVSEVKVAAGMAVHQPEREAALLARLASQGDDTLTPEDIHTLYHTILTLSKAAQARWRQAGAS